MIDVDDVRRLVRAELARVKDHGLVARISEFLVELYAVERPWDYGPPDSYVCWTVLEHVPSKTAVVYCDGGIGPRNPWGLVWISGSYMGWAWIRNGLQPSKMRSRIRSLPKLEPTSVAELKTDLGLRRGGMLR